MSNRYVYSQPRNKRRPVFLLLGGVLTACVIALAVGLGVGLSHHNHNNAQPNVVNAAVASPSSSATSSTTAAASSTITPFAKWDFTKQKMNGVAIGNYLILERWMNEEWFIQMSSPNCWDEWCFTSTLGANAPAVLQAHWASWFTEQDVQTIAGAGFNHIRLPVPFWALIPTQGDEPYYHGTQMQVVQNVLSWCYANNLYVEFDMHAMPGNQNGEQESGQNITAYPNAQINFFNATNQARSDAFLQAAVAWIQASNYSSVVSSIGVVNEPRPFNSASNLDALSGYYERSYSYLSASNVSIPMIFASGYVDNPESYWASFMAGKSPSLLAYDDHPYPGDFPLQYGQSSIESQVCNDAAGYEQWPVPALITEWSLTTGITDPTFLKQFYNSQLSAWSWNGGGIFWAYYANASAAITEAPSMVALYSWVTQYQSTLAGTNATQIALTDTSCGQAPTRSWVNPIPSSGSS